MNKNRQKWAVAMLAVLLVLLIVFIFSNSMKSGEESNEDSAKIVKILKPIIDKVFGEDKVDVNYAVRKGAHLAEFALLGLFTFSLVQAVTRYNGKKLMFAGFFVTLAVAVTDEYIQLFTGRTSSVSDILIDFSGALIGMLTAFVICILTKKDRM